VNEIETILTKILKCDRQSLYLNKRCSSFDARPPTHGRGLCFRIRPQGGKKRDHGHAHHGAPLLDIRKFNRLEHILQKRISGQPLQYLIGEVEFMGLRLRVKPGVFIPRPETEILVEEVLKGISSLKRVPSSILDIGTGSGNIAIALAASKDLAGVQITAVDNSLASLSVACANARLHHLQDRIVFLHSDLFSVFEKKDFSPWDFIISNPPYISGREYAQLPVDVQKEPTEALLAEEDGFYFYRRIEEGARKYLAAGGMVFLEIGAGQAEGIRKIFSDSQVWKGVEFVRDYNNIDRVVLLKRISSYG
jgi:release factor glutamine methyltransferase